MRFFAMEQGHLWISFERFERLGPEVWRHPSDIRPSREVNSNQLPSCSVMPPTFYIGSLRISSMVYHQITLESSAQGRYAFTWSASSVANLKYAYFLSLKYKSTCTEHCCKNIFARPRCGTEGALYACGVRRRNASRTLLALVRRSDFSLSYIGA